MSDFNWTPEELDQMKRLYLSSIMKTPQYQQPTLGPEDQAVEAMVRQDLLERQKQRQSPMPQQGIDDNSRNRALLGLGTGLMGDAAKFGVQYATGPGESTMPAFERSMLGAMDYRDKAQRQLGMDREAARDKDIKALKYLADMRKGKWTEGAKPGDILKGLQLDQPEELQKMKGEQALTQLGVRGKQGIDLEHLRQKGALGLEREKQKGRMALQKAKPDKEAKEKDSKAFQQENQLRTSYLLQSKHNIEAILGYEKVKQSASGEPTGQKDIALIFGYMKVLDPTSTVREGEFATAQNVGNVPQSVWNLYNRLMTGERLQPEQRQGFVEAARTNLVPHLKRQQAVDLSYEQMANRYGLNPQNILQKVDYSTMLPKEMREAGGPVRIGPQNVKVTKPDGTVVIKKGMAPEDIQKIKNAKGYKVEVQ